MILETVRVISDALGHLTYGVNAQLASLDIDSGDIVPTNIVKIANETENFLVALGRAAEPYPSLNVALDEDVELEQVLTSHRDGTVTVAIRVALSNDQAHNGMRDTYYYLRAVAKTLLDLGSNSNVADRTRNNVCVGVLEELTHRPLFKELGDTNGLVTGQLIATYAVRDTNP